MCRTLLRAFLISSLTALAPTAGASAQALDRLLTIENPEPARPAGNDNFGISVVPIDESRIAAGAPLDDPINPNTGIPVSNAGSVYIVDRTAGALLRAIRNPNLQVANDEFGASIAVAELVSGQRLLVVGAPLFDVPTPSNAGAGAVYVFDIDGYAPPLRILSPTPWTNAQFGTVVRALGSYVLVGAPLDDPQGIANAGSVVLYRVGMGADGGIHVFSSVTINNPDPHLEDRFGAAIALRDTGGEPDVVVGAPGYDLPNHVDAGRVYVFRGTNPNPIVNLRLTLQAPDEDLTLFDDFGAAIAVGGTDIFVGAPGFDNFEFSNVGRVYRFDVTAGVPLSIIENPEPASGATFGTVLAANAMLVAAGAPAALVDGNTGAGKVYVFPPNDVVPSLTITNPDPAPDDRFGNQLAADGASLLIGAPFDQGSGVMFVYSTGGVKLLAVANPEPPTLATPSNFGYALTSIRRDKNDPRGGWDLVIGAETANVSGFASAGSAYLHDGDTGGLLLTMHNPTPRVGAFCGAALAGVDRPPDDPRGGQDILVGCMRNNVHRSPTVVGSSEPGAAYLYNAARRGDAPGPDILLLHPEMPSNATDIEHYGAQVLGVGDKIIISSMWGNYRAPDEDGREGYGATLVRDTGAVFVIDRSDPTNPHPPVIQDPAHQFQNQFGGNSVQSIARVPREPNDPRGPGFDLLISAPLYDDGVATNAGRAYLFDGLTHEKLFTIKKPTPELGEMLGTTVAAMGTKLVLGAPGAPVTGVLRAGAVYVFDGRQRGDDTVEPLVTIPNPLPGRGDGFGAALTVLGDDIFVGAPGDGPDGIIQDLGAGSVFVFDGRDGKLLATLPNPDPDDPPSAPARSQDDFGAFLAPLGGRFAVSATADDRRNADGTVDPAAGAVYVYDWDSVPPVMLLAGPSDMTIECCSAFTEPGYSAYDERPLSAERSAGLQDPIDLTDTVAVSRTVDPSTPGMYVLTYTVNDPFGNRATKVRTVHVVDTTPPVIVSARPRISSLWPPNHKMVPVTIAVNATDAVDPAPACSIRTVTSNEPINGMGDGDTAPDWQFSPNSLLVNLRAERSGRGTGRTYTIAIACADRSGNVSTATTFVAVPHDQGK